MTAATLTDIYNHRVADNGWATSGQPSIAQLAVIAAAGYRTVINLALHDDPRYSLPDEAGTVRSLGMVYVHIPVQFASPTEDELLAFFAALEAHGQDKLWIHCAANLRVSAFLGLYRVLREGWDVDAAFALMRELWQPDEVWAGFIDRMLRAHR